MPYMTLIQRLRRDPKIGLNYDSMGYAEYEFGATRAPRADVTRPDDECCVIKEFTFALDLLKGKVKVNCGIRFPQRFVDNDRSAVFKLLTALGQHNGYSNKGIVCYGSADQPLQTNAWMMIYPMPALIYTSFAQESGDLQVFIDNTREQIREGYGGDHNQAVMDSARYMVGYNYLAAETLLGKTL